MLLEKKNNLLRYISALGLCSVVFASYTLAEPVEVDRRIEENSTSIVADVIILRREFLVVPLSNCDESSELFSSL